LTGTKDGEAACSDVHVAYPLVGDRPVRELTGARIAELEAGVPS
jgi:hypothetical protein